jgi:S-adenosylmethionine synthetase
VEVVVEPLSGVPVARQRVEYVERKGLGHPDSICDAMMEAVSVALSEAYLDRFGRVLHHNIDKGLLVAGQTCPSFGGGVVEAPMRVVVGDRATSSVGDVSIPVGEIVDTAIRTWMRDNLRLVDPDLHLILQNELRPGSAELTGIFDRKQLVANDTSAVVGYAPLSETDRIVLTAERFLNSEDFKQGHPEAGEDVKVMGVRQERRLALTVAVGFVDRFVSGEAAYFDAKHAIAGKLLEYVTSQLECLDVVTVDINKLDREGCGADGTYLTVLGTSAESGDGGQVGRGNRVNGLITFNRPMTLEAAAGKNPVSHVGKIYNLLAHETARVIWSSLDEVEEVYVWMCSQIGEPLDQPWQVSAQLALASGADLPDIESKVRDIILDQIASIDSFTTRLSHGELPVC